MVAEQILSRLKNVRKNGNGWIASCPAHKDSKPSLSISEATDKMLLHCHAGCSNEAVVQAMGLKLSDLFNDKSLPQRRQVAEYKYTDEQGKYLFSVIRFEPKDFKQRTAEGWGLNGVRRVLYRLPRVLEAIAEEETIYIVEGEKDVLNLEKLGLYATTSLMGAGKWQPEYSASLEWANVCILPDNDKPGREHARQIAESLQGKAKLIKLLNLPGLPEKGDVSDWLNNGGSKEKLLHLVEDTPQYNNAVKEEATFEQRIFIPTWRNEPARQEPLVTMNGKRILTLENIALLTAFAGHGKTSIFEAACASTFQGCTDSLGIHIATNRVLYIDTERAHADSHAGWRRTMKRGNVAPDSDTSRLRWECIRTLATLEERRTYLWDRLEAECVPALVIVDGFGDFVADINDPEECTGFVYRLSSIACERRIGIWGSLHTNPGQNNQKARGVLGSELWRKSESSLIIEKLPDGFRRLTTDYGLGKNRSEDDKLAVCFRWDDEVGMHITCDAPANSKTTGKAAAQRSRIVDAMDGKTYPHSDMVSLIMNVIGIQRRAACDRIHDLVTAGMVEKNEDNTYQQKATKPHWSDEF